MGSDFQARSPDPPRGQVEERPGCLPPPHWARPSSLLLLCFPDHAASLNPSCLCHTCPQIRCHFPLFCFPSVTLIAFPGGQRLNLCHSGLLFADLWSPFGTCSACQDGHHSETFSGTWDCCLSPAFKSCSGQMEMLAFLQTHFACPCSLVSQALPPHPQPRIASLSFLIFILLVPSGAA